MTERIRLRIPTVKISLLRGIYGVTLLDKVGGMVFRDTLHVKPLLLRVERPQTPLRKCGKHVSEKNC